MVIPCYNKAEYIGGMFDSIIAQKWDNIELVLVNDGSTDGTREIIAEYKPKFLSRGFEVVIIDQENKGLPGAVYEGLKRITGDFLCQVDADDELDPEYVGTMAGWLWGHAEYSWAACEVRFVQKSGESRVNPFPLGAKEYFKIETFILVRMMPSIWKYMIRTSYLRSCRVMEHYFHQRFGSQEPQLLLPLLAGNGNFEFFPRQLYTMICLRPEDHHSYKADYTAAAKYHRDWFVPVKETIKHLPVNSDEKQRLAVISDFSYYKQLIRFDNAQDAGYEKALPELIKKYTDMVNIHFTPAPNITDIGPKNVYYFIKAVEDNILGVNDAEAPIRPPGRLIAWGALGARARRLLPRLEGTLMEPCELWDAAGDGEAVKNPDPASLVPEDTVIVLPANEVACEIRAELSAAGCTVISPEYIMKYYSYLKFTQFYDGSVAFTPKGE